MHDMRCSEQSAQKDDPSLLCGGEEKEERERIWKIGLRTIIVQSQDLQIV